MSWIAPEILETAQYPLSQLGVEGEGGGGGGGGGGGVPAIDAQPLTAVSQLR